MRAILHGMEGHADLVARLHRIAAPTLASKLTWPAHLKGPLLGLACTVAVVAMMDQEWGLIHSKALTVPSRVSTLSLANMAKE